LHKERRVSRLTRFVDPSKSTDHPIKLPLTEGDWIEIKPRLSTGEIQTIEAASLRAYRQTLAPGSPGAPRVEVDLEAYGLVRNFVWLRDWSLKDADDKPVTLTIQALAALDPDTTEEIDVAITGHIKKLEAEKKARAAVTTASPMNAVATSPSPST
jgi:hypothetical protein